MRERESVRERERESVCESVWDQKRGKIKENYTEKNRGMKGKERIG